MKKIMILLCALACVMGITACTSQQESKTNAYSVYYLSNSETKVETHEYQMKSETQEEQVQEMLLVLQTNPSSLQYKAPLAMGFQLTKMPFKDAISASILLSASSFLLP